MKHGIQLLASAIGCLVALAAHADVVTYSGNTSAGSTYNRVDVDAAGNPTGASPLGTAVNFNTFTFTTTGGDYSFSTAGAYDTFTSLYSGTFTPATPPSSALIGNTTLVTSSQGTAGFSIHLDAGTYSYVTSSFLNGQSGFFTTSINGSAAITPVTPLTTAPASPRVLTVTGSTTTGGTYDRADLDADGNPVASSDSVAFKTFQFMVGAVGTYSAIANGDYDTFLSLYAGSFDPNNPLANLVTLNDDAVSGTDADGNFLFVHDVSSIAADLVPGVTYILVTAGFDSESAGSFADAITGPGAVNAILAAAIPEPESLALMLMGIVAAGLAARRRRKA